MTTSEVSASQVEITRKIGERTRAEVGARTAQVTQVRAAELMGVSASTVCRLVAELDAVCHFLAAIGLQVAPLDAVVVSKARIEAMELFAYEYLRARAESRGAL